MNALVDSFSRALGDLIERRKSEFNKAFGTHVGTFSQSQRTGSGMDAFGRLEIARSVYKDTVNEVMENALNFSKVEGVSISKLLTATQEPMSAFAGHIADTAKFPAAVLKQAPGDGPAKALTRLRTEFAQYFDSAVNDALAGRVGFARVSPLPFHRAAINAVRDNPWLLLTHGVSVLIGLVLGYFGLS